MMKYTVTAVAYMRVSRVVTLHTDVLIWIHLSVPKMVTVGSTFSMHAVFVSLRVPSSSGLEMGGKVFGH